MTEKEPTFRIEIRACSFQKLSIEHLAVKLKKMHDLGFTGFFTIVEDTNNPEVPIPGLPRPETKEK